MRVILNQQDIIDATCVFDASHNNHGPEDVEAELFFDQRKGFTAEIDSPRERRLVKEQWLIDAICFYMSDYYSYNIDFLTVELFFEDGVGFTAAVNVQTL